VKRKPLPPELPSDHFSVGAALALGVSHDRLRAADLERPFWGTRMVRSETATLEDRCATLATRLLPSTFYSHATAALLLGAPLPLAMELEPRLHVAVPAPAARLHSRELVGHRIAVRDGDVIVRRGIRITSPARTWLDLAATLELDDLVAVGDYLIHWRTPLVARGELRERLEQMAGTRGVRLARAALDLLDDRPESRPESLLRLILLRSGLPEPEINHSLVDSVTGRQVRPDFRFRQAKLLLEYQGDYHRTREQWRKDMTRRTRLEAQGWKVLELNADDLKNPAELVERIRLWMALRANVPK